MRISTGGLLFCLLTASATASGQTYSKTETIEYHDDLSLWVLGQVKRTTTNGVETSKTDYGWKALPWKTYSFGKLQQTLSYDSTSTVASGQLGTIKTVSDGRDGTLDTTITLSNWKRGIPQSIKYPVTAESPTGAIQSAVVNDDGTIAAVIDESGYRTCYAYDPMGRVNKITYPSETQVGVCDTSAWTATTISFNSQTAAAYGMAAGHWRQTVLTGNGRKIQIFDALWRPVVEQTLDLGNVSNTTTEVFKRYDTSGRLAFQSYPMNSYGQAVYTDTALKGTRTSYDVLDRVTDVEQDSELPAPLDVLATKTSYLSDANGPYTLTTNPRGYVTRTWFQMFDQPDYSRPVTIWHPEGAYTHITRDVFGKPTQLRRSNNADRLAGTVAENRDYTYDNYQQLCRTVEPETGAHLFGYDLAGNLSWSASGLAAGTACDLEGDTTEILARKASRTYDARNRIKTLDFADLPGDPLYGAGDTTYSYFPDGQLQSIAADNAGKVVTSTYQYNRRRLLTREQLQWTNDATVINWPVDYTYNANGHLASQYWHGLTVDYAPNALGQPTKAGSFASGVHYWPNGAIKEFTFGNGILHTMTQNIRGLPDAVRDSYDSYNYRYDGYDYDQNGNVAAISDALTGSRFNRDMTYDGLDRLITTTSPMYGTDPARYAYDVLDNLTRVVAPGRNDYYCYDSHWQLTNIKSLSCAGTSTVGLGYDAQGNLENRNGRIYKFDIGNRLRSVSAQGARPASSYAYDGHGRRVWDLTTADQYSQYSLDGRLVMTTSARSNKVDEYIQLGGSLLAIRERDVPTGVYTIKYQHTDALGSTVAETDGNRTVLGPRTEYEPYGKVLVPTSPPDEVGYAGHFRDESTGLNYMQQRYYDPQIGRFLSVDPVTANGNTGGNFNRYWYANNNPYRFTDPDGRLVQAIEGPIIVAGVAATLYYLSRSPEEKQKFANEMGKKVEKVLGGLFHRNESLADDGSGNEGNSAEEKPRFIAQPDGQVVDTEATPAGSYDQPDGGRTDILQGEDHGAGRTHTHDPVVNTNPKTGDSFVNGRERTGRQVSEQDVRNIQSGDAPRSKPTGRSR